PTFRDARGGHGSFDSLSDITSLSTGGPMRTDHMSVDNSGEITAKGKAMLSSLSFLVLLLALLFFAAHSARAAAGDLDPRFGNGGVVQTDFAQTDDYVFAVGMQPDGKIIVSGQSGIYPDLHSALVRYNRNGRLDSTFGTGGKVVVMFPLTATTWTRSSFNRMARSWLRARPAEQLFPSLVSMLTVAL